MAAKQKKEFIGRVLWYDTTTHHDYQYEQTKNAVDRMGKFIEIGLIDVTDPDAIIVKFGIEVLDLKTLLVKGIRDHTDVPRGKKIIYKVQEHLGGDKWRDIKV